MSKCPSSLAFLVAITFRYWACVTSVALRLKLRCSSRTQDQLHSFFNLRKVSAFQRRDPGD